MKELGISIFFAVLLLTSCLSESSFERIDSLTVLHLYGEPYERGFDHGQFLKNEINENTDRFLKEVELEFDTLPGYVFSRFFAETGILSSVRDEHPELLEEVRGLSDGSGLDYHLLLAYQLSEELFTIMSPRMIHHCTAIGYKGNDTLPCILGQNMDPPLFLHGHPVLIHNVGTDDKPASFVFSVAGHLGLTGMNSEGLAICCNGISMLNHDTIGLPVVSVVQKALSFREATDAADFIKEAGLAIPQCYSLAGQGSLWCLECSPGIREEFYPFGSSDLVLHTNFSINNRDFNQDFIRLLEQYGKTPADPYFCPRYFHSYDEILKRGGLLTHQDMKVMLRMEEPEMEPVLNIHTLGTLIMETGPEPQLYLATGNKQESAFHLFVFQPD